MDGPRASGHEQVARLDRVSVTFGRRCALDDVTFGLRRGEVALLAGPNGAGKSTALGVLLGHLRPSRGDVVVRGASVRRDPLAALAGVGFVPDEPGFHGFLTGRDNLRLLAAYADTGEEPSGAIRAAVARVGLTPRIDDRVATYSHGMRKRLALAQALVPSPDLLVLDEPVDGLDPDGIDDVHRILGELARDHGVAVLLASHLLGDVEPICDRILVLREGRLVYDAAFRAGAGRTGLRDVYRAASCGPTAWTRREGGR